MYCGDNLGTDIDHFDPIGRTSLKTFHWPNHLLACSFCNSNQKRDKFPCDAQGSCLLVDPTSEDPNEHLRLILSSGQFIGRTEKGRKTIEVFGLNRPDLIRGRWNAFLTRSAVLCRIHELAGAGRDTEARNHMWALSEEPHASVLNAMLQTVELPDADDILGPEIVATLRDPKMQQLMDRTWRTISPLGLIWNEHLEAAETGPADGNR